MIIALEEAKRNLASIGNDIKELGVALRVDSVREEVASLEAQTSDPSFWSDQEKSGPVLQKIKSLKGKLQKYDALCSRFEDAQVLCEMAIEEDDESMTDEVISEVKGIEEEEERQKIEVLLSGEYDANNAILSFHPGAGGTEAQDWALMLYRMYTRWAEKHGYTVKLIDWLDGDEAGLKSATITVEGLNAYGYLKSENGVHRLVRVSPFDASGRRHTSFASVEVMPEFEDDGSIEIRPEDIEVTAHRSSGAGGQHINKTESAIRIIHIPTGIVVECQDERSQFKNKDKAMKILKTKLYDMKRAEQHDRIASERKSQVGTGERCERIRTYNYPQGRVTDHRISFTLHSISSFLDGNIDEMINALITADTVEKLRNSEY